MIQLKIVKTYEEDDKNFSGDALNVTLFVDGSLTLSGDQYHDKIVSQIEGFKVALHVLGVEYAITREYKCERD